MILSRISEILNNKKLCTILSIISIIVFVVLTLTNPDFHSFNYDELWVYSLAQDLTPVEIIKIMKYELHFFVWFFIIKPFTYFPQTYPFILKYLNWFFAFSAICVFHKFAPINTYLKILITFTMPFLLLYPLEARCYGIGILLLFILAALYKNRLKHPVLFSILIFFTANTSLMVLLGAFAISILFLIDLIKQNLIHNKNYKGLILPVFILFLTALSLIIQWYNYQVFNFVNLDAIKSQRIDVINNFYFGYENIILKNISYIVFCLIAPIVFLINIIQDKKQSIKLIFFLCITIVFINILFLFFYNAHFHHLGFVFVYLILIYWLKIESQDNFKSDTIAYKSYTLLLIMVSLLFFTPLKSPNFWFHPFSSYIHDIQTIKDIIPKNSTIYMPIEGTQGIIPSLKNDYDLRTLHGRKIPSFEAYKYTYHEDFIPPEEFVSKNENSYFIVNRDYAISYNYKYLSTKHKMLVPHDFELFFVYKLNPPN